MKIEIFVRNKDGTLIDIITAERDIEEYIEDTREIYGEQWAEYLERLCIDGAIDDDITL